MGKQATGWRQMLQIDEEIHTTTAFLDHIVVQLQTVVTRNFIKDEEVVILNDILFCVKILLNAQLTQLLRGWEQYSMEEYLESHEKAKPRSKLVMKYSLYHVLQKFDSLDALL